MLDFLIFAVTFVVILIIAVIYLYPSSKKVTTVPGANPSDEKLGNFGDIGHAGNLHNYLAELHEKHGPIASFWWGTQLAISVAGPKLYKELQTTFDRPLVIFQSLVNVVGEKSIQFKNGAEGRHYHTTLKKPFTFAAMSNYQSILDKISDDFLAKLHTHTPTDHLPLMQTMFSLAIKAISITSFGSYFSNEKHVSAIWRAYDSMMLHWENLVQKENKDFQKKFEQDRAVIFNAMKEAISQHRANPDTRVDPQERAFLDELLELCDNDNEDALSNAVSFFIAGFHTTGLLLTWVVYFLSIDSDVQEKVYREVVDVLGTKRVTPPDMKKLKYCTQVINEAIRCSCLGTYAARSTDFDIELDGHKIQAGTPIILALGALSHNEEVWEDPTKFDPERFSESAVKSRHPNSFHPFGLGKRICPGYTLSLFEAHVILSSLVRSYKIHLVEGQVVTPQYGFVTKPAEEIWVTFEKRK